MPLYRENFGKDRSSSFGREQPSRNCTACSRRGSAYFVKYLRMYWTDCCNIFTVWKRFTCWWWIQFVKGHSYGNQIIYIQILKESRAHTADFRNIPTSSVHLCRAYNRCDKQHTK